MRNALCAWRKRGVRNALCHREGVCVSALRHLKGKPERNALCYGGACA